MVDREQQLQGIHHVTAIAADPQENIDFYTGVLGLRLVKRSVNQDDPGTYHLFYADAVGTPGTDLTFFPWPGGRRGRRGAGQTTAVALAIPAGAVSYWKRRLAATGTATTALPARFDEEGLAFTDPHGLALELVAVPGVEMRPWVAWADSPVPPEQAIRGIHGVTLASVRLDRTEAFLAQTLGFRVAGESSGRRRFVTDAGGSGAVLDLLEPQQSAPGVVAVGTVHHVAWRTQDAGTQRTWWEALGARGVGVSPIIDRFWFSSIYFHEPGGALFEIATDGPGFAVDEATETLGSRLILPPWLEPRRPEIERVLPPLRAPAPSTGRVAARPD